MVIDSSALVAVIAQEPEAGQFLRIIQGAASRKISAASFFETGMVLKRDTTGARMALFEEFLTDYRVTIAAITEAHARIALGAFDRYGKGRGHPAQLNFGDCFSYVLAKTSGEPLLFKANDFIHTDLQVIHP